MPACLPMPNDSRTVPADTVQQIMLYRSDDNGMSMWNCRMLLQTHFLGCHCIMAVLQAATAKLLSQQWDCHCKATYIALQQRGCG
jgi:hypothetical protein